MTAGDRITAFLVRWFLNVGALMLIAQVPQLFGWVPPSNGVAFAVALTVGGMSALATRPLGRASPVVLLVNALLFWVIIGKGLLNGVFSLLSDSLVYGSMVTNATAAFMGSIVYGIVALLTSFLGGSTASAADGETQTLSQEEPKP